MIYKVFLTAFVPSVFLLSAPVAQAAVLYKLTELGVFNNTPTSLYPIASRGIAINNNGQVVGSSDPNLSMTYPTAFITNTKGIINSDTSNFTEALSINASGQVAGYFQAYSRRIGAIGPYAVLVTKNKVKNLDTLGSQYSFAYDVNDKGEVTGYRAVKTGGDRAFVVTSKGVMKDLPSDTGVSATYAYAINNKSQVAGYASTHVGDRAFVTLNGAMKYLGVLGGFYSKAYGLNDKGQVVGLSDVAYNSPYTHAFVTVNGVIKDLGALRAKDSSTALGINNQGQIVGYSSSDTKSIGHITGWSSAWMSVADRAFVTIKGKMTDLNSLIDPRIKWKLARANAINDKGQITGVGINPKGVRTAFLLSPINIVSVTKRRRNTVSLSN